LLVTHTGPFEIVWSGTAMKGGKRVRDCPE